MYTISGTSDSGYHPYKRGGQVSHSTPPSGTQYNTSPQNLNFNQQDFNLNNSLPSSGENRENVSPNVTSTTLNTTLPSPEVLQEIPIVSSAQTPPHCQSSTSPAGEYQLPPPYTAVRSQGFLSPGMKHSAYQKYVRLKERQRKLRALRQGRYGADVSYDSILSLGDGAENISDTRSMASLMSYTLGEYNVRL